MKDIRCGWTPPTLEQKYRAALHAHPEAGSSVLAKIKAAPTSSNLALTCDLDQGNLGSCQSNGPAQIVYMAMMKLGGVAFILARLWLYRCIRYIEGTLNQDSGGSVGDAFIILAKKGIPSETIWPYDISRFKDDPGPSVDRFAYDSRGNIGINYRPISSTGETLLTDIEKACTAGYGITFGCAVSNDFCSTQPSGTVQGPHSNSEVAGGHCMSVVGHDRLNRRLLVKNSWGRKWGDPTAGPGCFWMDYAWFVDPNYGASDIWIVTAVPGGIAQ